MPLVPTIMHRKKYMHIYTKCWGERKKSQSFGEVVLFSIHIIHLLGPACYHANNKADTLARSLRVSMM
jgi:hypothetical protein